MCIKEVKNNIELPNHYDWNLPIKSKAVIDEVIKYNIRHNKKNGVEDLKKAIQYLKWTVEELEKVI